MRLITREYGMYSYSIVIYHCINKNASQSIKLSICYSYTMVIRDLSRKTTRSPRVQPEGEVWFSVINLWLPWYKCYISSA